MVYSTLVTLRRKGYQGRSPWLVTFRRKIGWRWLLDRIDWFAENCKIGRIWVDVGRDH